MQADLNHRLGRGENKITNDQTMIENYLKTRSGQITKLRTGVR